MWENNKCLNLTYNFDWHPSTFKSPYKVISVVIRKEKIFHLLFVFYQHDLVMPCVFTFLSLHNILIFCILLSSFLASSCCPSNYILEFWLLEMKMEDQIWSKEKYWMKSSYYKKILLEWIYIYIYIYMYIYNII